MNFTIIEQIALFIPIILGAFLTISLMKIPNLSIESGYLFGAIMGSQVLMLEGNSSIITLFLAIILSLCGGACTGIIAALLSQYAQFSHILSAIITMGLFHGIAQWVLGGAHLTIAHAGNPLKLLPYVPQFPELPLILAVSSLICLLFYFFLQTQLGISCGLYGDNITFLKNYRMNQSYVVISGMALGNGLAGISGYMIAQSNGFVDTSMGIGIPLLCLSSIIIGKSIISKASVLAIQPAIAGVIGYFIIQTMLLKIGFDLRYFTSLQAIIITGMLFLSSRITQSNNGQNLLGI